MFASLAPLKRMHLTPDQIANLPMVLPKAYITETENQLFDKVIGKIIVNEK